jgi:hypothetical protein
LSVKNGSDSKTTLPGRQNNKMLQFVVGLAKNAKTSMATATVVDILANKTFTGSFIGGI